MKKKYFIIASICAFSILVGCTSSRKDTNLVATDSSDYAMTDVAEISESRIVEHAELSEAPSESVQFTPPVISEDSEVSDDMEISSISELREVETDSKRRVQTQKTRAHLLTATQVNDFKKWDEWENLLQADFRSYQRIWNIAPSKRFVARATDSKQMPIVDAVVKLYDANQTLLWTARTDNTGTAQLWANAFLTSNNQNRLAKAPFKIVFSNDNESKTIANAQPYPQETNVTRFSQKSDKKNNVDIFFIVDATGSMQDELSYLQAELYSIINRVKRDQSNLNLRMGSLVYRDKGDDYLTRKSSLSSDINKTVQFLKQQYADGGGDTPEAVDEALYQAIESENWQQSALARIAFLVLDAPPHNNAKSVRRVNEQIALAANKGIRLVPLVASGMQQDGEYLMRCMALATNGTYVTLTDDSGIGNSHAKPTTDYFKVEKLNDLLIRLINEYTKVPQTI